MGMLIGVGIFLGIGFFVLLIYCACAAGGREDEIILREIDRDCKE
jgi:hypothetical protein